MTVTPNSNNSSDNKLKKKQSEPSLNEKVKGSILSFFKKM